MTARQRIPRALELVLLFGLFPVVLCLLSASGLPIPVIPLLVVSGIGAAVYLSRVAPAETRAALVPAWPSGGPWKRAELARIGLQLTLGGALLFAYVLALQPERLFALPRERPWAWALLIGLYPLLSVLPQELLFRVFFFHRYGALCSGPLARILVSAAVFGLAHLVYGNGTAVALSTVGGIFFSWTFARTGSLWLVVAEHSLYGMLLFTLGLGNLFGLPEAP
jgi:membrane protease YdiL (CAAX protease family)